MVVHFVFWIKYETKNLKGKIHVGTALAVHQCEKQVIDDEMA